MDPVTTAPERDKKPKRKWWSSFKTSSRTKSEAGRTTSTSALPSRTKVMESTAQSTLTPPTEVEEGLALEPASTISHLSNNETLTSSHHPTIEAEPDGIASTLPVVAMLEVDSEADDDQIAAVSALVNSASTDKGEAAKRLERAQALFQRYNLQLEEGSWDMHPKIPVERVNKAPRMRVRWTCHECKRSFGHDRICVECAHPRCRKCSRYPPKRKKSKAFKAATGSSAPATDALLTMVGNQQGTCHECQTIFVVGTVICANCQHFICERCLQETIAQSEQGIPPVANTSVT